MHSRLDIVFDEETIQHFIRLAALSLTGQAQSHRAFVLVTGPSGSGKGGAVNILMNALGQRAMPVGVEWLMQKERNEIDAIAADVLEQQPAILSCDEIGGDSRPGESRLNSLLGNTYLNNRRPHGVLLRGRARFQLWGTAVLPPQLNPHSGIVRRLAVLHTRGKLSDDQLDEAGGEDPKLLDAIVSLLARTAGEVYQRGYRAPEGNAATKAATLQEMDSLAPWLEEREDLDRMTVADARSLACKDLGLWDDLTTQKFGMYLRESTKWSPGKGSHGVRIIVRRQEGFSGMGGG